MRNEKAKRRRNGTKARARKAQATRSVPSSGTTRNAKAQKRRKKIAAPRSGPSKGTTPNAKPQRHRTKAAAPRPGPSRGTALFDDMRHQAGVTELVEQRLPDARELEADPTLWAEQRARTASRRTALEEAAKERRDVFGKGNVGALIDALLISSYRDGCLFGTGGLHADHWVGVPRWAVDALTVFVGKALPDVRVRGRGRHARWSAQWQQDCVDLERWKVVKELHKAGVRFTDRRVFTEAVKRLPRDSAGGQDAVRTSYFRVERRKKSEPWRYEQLDYGGVLIHPN